MKKTFCISLLFFSASFLFSLARTFDEVFPDIENNIRKEVLTTEGYNGWTRKKADLKVKNGSGFFEIEEVRSIADNNPSYIVENLLVIPAGNEMPLLSMFNILQNVRALAGQTYYSFTRKKEVPLFSEANRVDNLKTKREIPDPPPFSKLPENDTIFVRMKDVNFGNCFYRSELKTYPCGLLYTITNAEPLTALFFPVVETEKFAVRMYIEPLKEGTLIYSAAVISVSAFADSMANVPSAVQKRLDTITGWFAEGLKKR